MTVQRFLASTVVAALTVTGCSDQPAPTAPGAIRHPVSADLSHHQPGRYIVLFAAEQVPADFGERVATLGGSVEASLDSIGVAAVTGLSQAAADKLAATADVQSVQPDRVVTLKPDGVDDGGASMELTPSETLAAADATASPTAAQFYARQWNMRAVFADQAWAAGHRGSRDVVVALLDSGLDYTLPDFDGLVDLNRSKSFTPDEDPIVAERFPGRLPISDLFSHGTAVASVIGSKGTILAGVNQDVTLIAVKVFNRLNEGSVAQLLAGLVYAADQGADVINMSLGDTFDRRKDRASVAAVNRAANYAFRKGVALRSPPRDLRIRHRTHLQRRCERTLGGCGCLRDAVQQLRPLCYRRGGARRNRRFRRSNSTAVRPNLDSMYDDTDGSLVSGLPGGQAHRAAVRDEPLCCTRLRTRRALGGAVGPREARPHPLQDTALGG